MNTLNHVAFIMDGNGRWGKKRGKGRNYGHQEGIKTVKKIVESSIKFNIPLITFYVFSTENWKRPKSEINFLFSLINNYFDKEISNILKNNIKINILGTTKNLNLSIKKTLHKVTKLSMNNKKLTINLALNYGSKDEIINAFNQLRKKKISINQKNLERMLYTKGQTDPDILIRTGGQKRLSNFMLWQLAYTELYFIDKLWPDFKEYDYFNIIKKFKLIKRNYGAI